MTKSIYLSPSTQERNIGYGNYGSDEYRMNQAADVVEKILIDHGIKVYRNRPDWDLKEVIKDSNLRNLTFTLQSIQMLVEEEEQRYMHIPLEVKGKMLQG